MDTGVGNLTFPVFREDRFQLGFEKHTFPADLVAVKHPFVELAFAERDVDAIRCIAFQMHDDHIVRMGSEYFPFVFHSVLFIDCCGNRIRDV